MEDQRIDSLIYLTVASITNTTSQKFASPLLNLFLLRADSQKTQILSKQCNLSGEKCLLEEEALALCGSRDYLQLQLLDQGKVAASMKFPLQQMLQMPRVAHEIECLLLKAQKWDSVDRSPLRHIAQVDLTIMPFNKDLGKFVISGVEIELTRNTELIGQMDPYVQFLLQDEMKQTQVRDNEGMHCIWNQRLEFSLQDINKSFTLTARVLDKDNLSSDLVGTARIDLVQQRMLLANEEVRSRSFTLLYGAQSAGKIKLEFQFIPKQFNF